MDVSQPLTSSDLSEYGRWADAGPGDGQWTSIGGHFGERWGKVRGIGHAAARCVCGEPSDEGLFAAHLDHHLDASSHPRKLESTRSRPGRTSGARRCRSRTRISQDHPDVVPSIPRAEYPNVADGVAVEDLPGTTRQPGPDPRKCRSRLLLRTIQSRRAQ